MGVEWFGMVMGLGFVLSFGYWCTDFLVIQRAMAAESMTAARRTPIFAAIPKMLFPGPGDPSGNDRHRASHDPRRAAAGGERRDTQLQPRRAGAAGPLSPVGPARSGPHGAHGLVHVRHGRERHGVQHGVDLRHLSVLHPTGAVRPALPPDGPHRHRVRDRLQRGGGVRDDAVQQHHGHAPAGVRVRQRAAVRDVSAGDVLAARHRPRRVLRPADRDRRGGHPSRAHPAARRGARAQRGVPRSDASRLPQRNGAELLDRDRRLDGLLRGARSRSRSRRHATSRTRSWSAWSTRSRRA